MKAEDVFGEDLWREAQGIVKEVHDLLNGPDGNGQLDGTYEIERYCLNLAKGLSLLAAYEDFKWNRDHSPGEWAHYRSVAENSDGWRRGIRSSLTMMVWNELHDRLHLLATGGHSVLTREARRRKALAESEKPSNIFPIDGRDDDVPF